MRLPLSPLKLVMMFWPIYVLAALGIALFPKDWMRWTPDTLFLAAFPVLVLALGLAVRDRCSLELTDEALIHHSLFKREVFAWARMGPVEIRAQHLLHLPLIRTLWFPFPLDAPHGVSEAITKRIGRRLLLVFGDRSGRETLELIEGWRRGSRLG